MDARTSDDTVAGLLRDYRAARRAFQAAAQSVPDDLQALPADGRWSPHDVVAQVAVWLDEGNDRVPRLMAGAPSLRYDVDAFNVAAVARGTGWSYTQAIGAFRRAADLFETIIAETHEADLLDSDGAMCWLRRAAREMMTERLGSLARLGTTSGIVEARADTTHGGDV